MNSRTDQQLLAEYAERNTEASFAELVRRHVDLVHSAALRMVRDTQLAEDVTQSAFLALSKNAAQLTNRPVLSGWLHRTAQNIAANVVRSDVRRRAREQEAATMNQLLSETPDASWEEIAPHLDTLLGELGELDRDAVLLRYFQKKSAQEMAADLGITSETAQKRVNRAIERLRALLVKRGVTVGAGGLVVVLTANGVQAAPAGLAIAITTAALATPVAAAAITTSAVATTKAIAMTTLQKTLVTATVVVLAGAGIYEARQASQLQEQVNALAAKQAPMAQQLQEMQRDRDEATNQLAALRQEMAKLPDNNAELLRLRGMAGVARRAIAENEQLRARPERQANDPATNLVTGAMANAMKVAMDKKVESQIARMTATLHLTPEQTQAVREILSRQARAMSAGIQQGISGNYDKAELTRLAREAGNVDEQIKELLTSDQRAAYPTYQQEEASHTASLAANQELLQMQNSLNLAPKQMDGVYAALYQISFNQLTGKSSPTFANQTEATIWIAEQKTQALEPLLTESQLQDYKQQLAAQNQLVKEVMERLENSGKPK